MKDLSIKIENIVNKFIEENVPENTIEDFIIAAIHFNINLNACTKYDLMRIDHKANELAKNKRNEILTTASVFSYILFKSINNHEIPKEDVLNVKSALMKISTTITDFMTYKIDEKDMNKCLYTEIKGLGL